MSLPTTEGVRFACQGSGKCCISRGEYGYVYLSLDDRRLLAKKLKTTTQAFTRKYCRKVDQFWALKDSATGEECVFLRDSKFCSVYEARPTQCRTWPFWPEVMNAKRWQKDVVKFCPGIGKGKLYSPTEVNAIMQSQKQNELDMVAELEKLKIKNKS